MAKMQVGKYEHLSDHFVGIRCPCEVNNQLVLTSGIGIDFRPMFRFLREKFGCNP